LKRRIVLGFAVACTVSGTGLAQPVDARARETYARGKAAYQQGEYAEALQHFEDAYRQSRAPALLFNMAQAHRLSGPEHCQQALDLYRRYLVEDPRASNREEAAERVGEMRACVDRASAEPEPVAAPALPPAEAGTNDEPVARPKPATPPPAVKPDAPPQRTPVAAILVTGAGAALGVAGGILYLRARAKYDQVERSCPCEPGSFSKWETLTTVSYGLMAAGAVGTASGVSWLLLSGDARSARPVQGVLIQGVARF
jgi:tetratricopeptide (TPR) repeat protein